MPTDYVALLRGINVGGNNPVPMAALRECFAELGASEVATYIQSGNVLFDGGRRGAPWWTPRIETALTERFGYDATVVVRSHAELQGIVRDAPRGFGSEPDLFRYDVLFLKEPPLAADALAQVPIRAGVDTVDAGGGVLYHSRLTARATQSQLGKIVGTPLYRRMTIRNWRTTTKVLAMLDERAAAEAAGTTDDALGR
jgi:uncharacterized protein (DUF1697 family)